MEFTHEKNRQEAQWVRRAIGHDSQSHITMAGGKPQGMQSSTLTGVAQSITAELVCLRPCSSTIQQESKKPLGPQSVQGSSGQHQHQNEIAA